MGSHLTPLAMFCLAMHFLRGPLILHFEAWFGRGLAATAFKCQQTTGDLAQKSCALPTVSDVPPAQLDSAAPASNSLEKSMVRINKSHLRLNNKLSYVVSQDVSNYRAWRGVQEA